MISYMSEPLVSIILPAYNHEAYVSKMLDSVLVQDYLNKEFVVIDDGSTDLTGQLIEEWVKEHEGEIKVLYKSRANKGVSATLNELLSLASGHYIAGASSDDYLLPDSISRRLNYLLENPDKKAVFGDYQVIDDNDVVLHESGIVGLYGGRKDLFLEVDTLVDEVLNNFSVAGPVLMFERSAFNDIGFFDEGLQMEDWDMYLRLSAAGLLGFIDYPVAAYRWHDGCTCRNIPKDIELLKYQLTVLENNESRFGVQQRRVISEKIRRLKRKIFRRSVMRKLGLRRH